MLRDNHDMRLVGMDFKINDKKSKDVSDIIISDSINAAISENKKYIKVDVSRVCKFMPEEMFVIDIKYEKIFELTEEAIDKLNKAELNITEYIIENQEEYLTDVFSKISFIISFITNEVGVFPLITQPVKIEDDEE